MVVGVKSKKLLVNGDREIQELRIGLNDGALG